MQQNFSYQEFNIVFIFSRLSFQSRLESNYGEPKCFIEFLVDFVFFSIRKTFENFLFDIIFSEFWRLQISKPKKWQSWQCYDNKPSHRVSLGKCSRWVHTSFSSICCTLQKGPSAHYVLTILNGRGSLNNDKFSKTTKIEKNHKKSAKSRKGDSRSKMDFF